MKNLILFLFLCFTIISCKPDTNENTKLISEPMEMVQLPDSLLAKKVGFVFEGLLIKEYQIETKINTYLGEGNYPIIENIIKLNGKPYYTTSTVKSAELHFYSDVERTKFKPTYDSTQMKIYAHYPLESFDRYYNMLRQNQNYTLIHFYENQIYRSREVSLVNFGKTPIKP